MGRVDEQRRRFARVTAPSCEAAGIFGILGNMAMAAGMAAIASAPYPAPPAPPRTPVRLPCETAPLFADPSHGPSISPEGGPCDGLAAQTARVCWGEAGHGLVRMG